MKDPSSARRYCMKQSRASLPWWKPSQTEGFTLRSPGNGEEEERKKEENFSVHAARGHFIRGPFSAPVPGIVRVQFFHRHVLACSFAWPFFDFSLTLSLTVSLFLSLSRSVLPLLGIRFRKAPPAGSKLSTWAPIPGRESTTPTFHP